MNRESYIINAIILSFVFYCFLRQKLIFYKREKMLTIGTSADNSIACTITQATKHTEPPGRSIHTFFLLIVVNMWSKMWTMDTQ